MMEIKVGDIVYDKEYPEDLGFVLKIKPDETEPYYVLYKGAVVTVDQRWVDEYCVVLA